MLMIILMLILELANMLISGAVLMVLWNWFVSPALGFFELGLVQSMGLCLVIAFAVTKPPRTREEQKDTKDQEFIIERYLWNIFMNCFLLLLGFIIHLML